MVKHTISNNQCYVLVMCWEGFWSEDSLEKIVFDNLGRKPQQKNPSHRNYGEGCFYEYLRMDNIYKTTDLAKLEFSARPECRLKKEYGVNEAKR